MKRPLKQLLLEPTDMQAHLPVLAALARDLNVVEIGFRTGNSATAFLETCKTLVSVDIKPCDTSGFVETERFKFLLGDSTQLHPLPSDLLFIDGDHDFGVVMRDLERWGPLAKRYIALHDTARRRASGVRTAVFTWLARSDNHCWHVVRDTIANEGLMVLERLR